MKVYAVSLEQQGEKTMVTGVFKSADLAKKNVFEQEHMYDDEDVLLADQRDVTWLEEGDLEVATGLGGGDTYTITPLDLDISVNDIVRARMQEVRS